MYVNGNNYNVTTYPIGSGVTTQPSIRKTSSGIVLIAAPSPTSSSAKAVYKVNCGLLNGVDENGTQHTFFSLYPNPNNGNFNILNENTEKELSLDIYNLLGEKVYYQGITEQNSVLNLNLKSGVYFVNVIDKKGNKAVQKIIVQ
ncbi:MAG: T9SS type A sorting domain-containing protein [Bacteroidetes bacterium]|nr:T9SS type A sorting domain-containing protein [Bacteroidota bacterium]